MNEGITIDNGIDMDLDIMFVKICNKISRIFILHNYTFKYRGVQNKKSLQTICHLHQFECLYQPSGIQSTWTSEGLLVLSADTNPDPDS